MTALPPFLESALVTLQSMIEEWDSICSQVSDEQLKILEHGCTLVKDTYQEVATSQNAAESTQPEHERVSRLRGQRIHYVGSTARSDQRRKRRRTVDRSSVEDASFVSQSQGKNAMLGSPESIEGVRSLEEDMLQDDALRMNEQSPIEITYIPSPATSTVPDGYATEPDTLFIPEHTDVFPDRHDENGICLETGPSEDANLPNTCRHPSETAAPLFDSVQGSPSTLPSNPDGALGAPDPFLQAYNEFIEDALSHPFPNDFAALHDNASPALSADEQVISRMVARFQESINRRNFWLPHEDRRNPSTIVSQNQILGPLLRRDPMTPDVLHGVLYRILPDVFDIIEHGSHFELRDDLQRLTSPKWESSVSIVAKEEPELVIVDTRKRKITYVTTREMHEIDGAVNLPTDWIVQLYNPVTIDPSIEYTVLSVFLVEAECKSIHLTPTYSDNHLRRRYFEALLTREEQQSEVRIDYTGIQAERIAIRPAEANFMATSPLTNNIAEFHIDEFDPTLLGEALSARPKQLKDIRCLRILQYVHGTGSPQVLDHLKAAALCLERQVNPAAYNLREAHAARISSIHTALDSRGSTSHLGVVQSRFARLCYYREFQCAVESLRTSHKARRAERQKLARRQQQLDHVAEIEQTVITPRTIAMAEQYSETTGKSSSVVRDDVVRRLSIIYKRSSTEDQAEIKSQVDSYIRQGKILHLILQGCSSDTSPAVLLLIPTLAVTPLDVTSCVRDDKLKLKLRKPFKTNEIDDLSEIEAQWMGEALRILRPGIMADPPENALKLLQDGPTAIEGVGLRDSKQLVKDPFGLFA